MRTKDEEKMNRIIKCIDDYYFENNYTPTISEISDAMEMSKGNVHAYITEMSERGMIDRMSGEWRGIRTREINKIDVNMRKIPLVGVIACGAPIWAEENIESYLPISKDLIGNGEFFALRAKGKSMTGAGIDDGDIVFIRKQNFANEGQIIVALVDDQDATLKRFFKDEDKKKIKLHPENENYEDMFFDEIAIQGVAVKILKEIE
jgi:repressor LexA